MFDSTPTIGWSQIFRNWIRSKFFQFDLKIYNTNHSKGKKYSKNSIKINSKFFRFDSTSTLIAKWNDKNKTNRQKVYKPDLKMFEDQFENCFCLSLKGDKRKLYHEFESKAKKFWVTPFSIMHAHHTFIKQRTLSENSFFTTQVTHILLVWYYCLNSPTNL